ncbi:coiled-coil domain-containing protein 61-like [Sitophilus oryzae]|uniref:Centrosomal protein CCDC61 n=1 Tax=Sitophilus oryzae TaxID=7048 RepID=A0A6J2XV79_SITOR|nr:coiled-coil domain-containing protein 61-like [Sitophilus oryzae]
MGDPNLVTTYNFHGQEFLFKMNVLHNNLEILVTDKNTGEEWQCSYDATYVENLTQKTGNFKQFDIFVAMLKSGLLRTSESVSLDLLTFEDLELLRSRKITKSVAPINNNKRYLILTYVVEFDKIRYPLPLEYCGPPDPVILQGTIRRLEVELAKTKEQLALKNNNNESRKIYFLQQRIDELIEENSQLQEEINNLSKCLGKRPKNQILSLQKAVSNLEKSVVLERSSHHELVQKLQQDKMQLAKQLEIVKDSERSLKTKLNKALSQTSRIGVGDHLKKIPQKKSSSESIRTMFKRSPSPGYSEGHPIYNDSSRESIRLKKRQSGINRVRSRKSVRHNITSRSSSASSANKYLDTETEMLGSVVNSPIYTPKRNRSRNLKSRGCSGNSSRANSRHRGPKTKQEQTLDYQRLEEKIESLQKMLKNGLKEN